MTSMQTHAKGIEVILERREIPGVAGPYTKLEVTLTNDHGRNYFGVFFDSLAIEDLEQMRDALTAYLAENKVAANG